MSDASRSIDSVRAFVIVTKESSSTRRHAYRASYRSMSRLGIKHDVKPNLIAGMDYLINFT